MDHSKVYRGGGSAPMPATPPFFTGDVAPTSDPQDQVRLDAIEERLAIMESTLGMEWCPDCHGYHPAPDGGKGATTSVGTGGGGAVGSGSPLG